MRQCICLLAAADKRPGQTSLAPFQQPPPQRRHKTHLPFITRLLLAQKTGFVLTGLVQMAQMQQVIQQLQCQLQEKEVGILPPSLPLSLALSRPPSLSVSLLPCASFLRSLHFCITVQQL